MGTAIDFSDYTSSRVFDGIRKITDPIEAAKMLARVERNISSMLDTLTEMRSQAKFTYLIGTKNINGSIEPFDHYTKLKYGTADEADDNLDLCIRMRPGVQWRIIKIEWPGDRYEFVEGDLDISPTGS